ncbi:MAG: hypothetical protein HY782_06150 [Chloroflexi bacterium]|nr:hypothetical protein [Chloroflexota bacterium]
MRAVLDLKRTGFFWWGFLTALIFLVPSAWLVNVANFLRGADWLQPSQPPLLWLIQLRDGIDAFAKGLPAVIQFNPQGSLVTFGNFSIPNVVVGIVVGLLLLMVAFMFYARAAGGGGVLDDLLAMLFVYIVLRVEGATTAAIPIVKTLNDQAPQSYLIILLLFMLFQVVRGRGSRDSAVFFKILLEALLIAILILPRQTLDAVAWIVERPTKLHEFLALTGYFAMIQTVWALIGIFSGVVNLYNVGRGAPTPARAPMLGGRKPEK